MNEIKEQDRKLQQLLNLKKLEKPSDARWMEFEFSLERRRLALSKQTVRTSVYAFLGRFKRLALAANALLLVGILSHMQFNDVDSSIQSFASYAHAQDIVGQKSDDFVTDEMRYSDMTNLQMSVFSIDHSNNGVRYACDTINALHSNTNFNSIQY